MEGRRARESVGIVRICVRRPKILRPFGIPMGCLQMEAYAVMDMGRLGENGGAKMGCCICGEKSSRPIVYSDPYTAQEYCLLHALPEHKGMSTEEFNEIILELLIIEDGATRLQEYPVVDLRGTVFPGNIELSSWDNQRTLKGANLTNAKFIGSLTINDADILGPLTLVMATFVDRCSFNGTKFRSSLSFDGVQFSDDVDFSWIDALECIDFTGAKFSGGVDFYGSILRGGALFRNIDVEYQMSLDGLDIRSGTMRFFDLKDYAISNILFTVESLKNSTFCGCEWPKSLAQDTKALIAHSQIGMCYQMYQYLKRVSADEHNQPLVSRWHFREKLMLLKQGLSPECGILLAIAEDDRCSRHDRLIAWVKLTVNLANIINGRLLGLYWACSGFGERAVRAGVCIVILVGLSFLANITPQPWDWSALPGSDAANATMATIPFAKDIPGEGWVKLGRGLWQFFIAVQFTLFALAVRNRFRR